MTISSFGKNINLIKGWDFKPEDYHSAWNNGKLLTAQIETSNLCDLLCEYCFRAEIDINSKKRLPNEITVDRTLGVIDEIVSLGAKTINIIGAGEPTVDPAMLDIVKYISSKDVTPLIFTHGARLDEKLVQELYDNSASVIIKVNSFNPAVQDQLVNRYGYTEKRDKGLQLLLEAGFNKPTEQYTTRLGIDSVICKENKDEILDIHRYCRESNIMPLIKTFIPAGRTKDRTDMEISMQEFIEISEKAREIDKNQYNIEYQRLMPYLGGVPCTQCGQASMYITILGDIYECPGQQHSYGNIRDRSITDAFNQIKSEQKNFNFGCPPRIAYWRESEQFK